MNDKLKRQLHFLAEVDKMKNILRQTLLLDKSRQETDAEHSWHFALMAMTLFEYCTLDGVDINRVIKMALIHDLVEIYAGDVPAFDSNKLKNKSEIEKQETEAADKIFGLLPKEQASEYKALWEEFDKMETPDAQYAVAIDRLWPFFSNNLTDGHTWVKYNVTVDMVYKRMAPVKAVSAELWKLVEETIQDNCKKGFIKA